MKTRWKYHSENFGENTHQTVAWINADHPDWDVVSINTGSTGMYTIVVWREELVDTVEGEDK